MSGFFQVKMLSKYFHSISNSSKKEGLTSMGIKFGREYPDIIKDFTEALCSIEECYTFLEMTAEDWSGLEPEEQRECVQTLADDVFYGLGSEPKMHVGNCSISYDKEKHVIVIYHEEKLINVIYLV
jgi:hypothetical protein